MRNHPSKNTSLEYTYWQDEDMWLGHFDEFPDYMTQAKTLDELQANLMDIYKEFAAEHIPAVRRHAKLKLLEA